MLLAQRTKQGGYPQDREVVDVGRANAFVRVTNTGNLALRIC